MKSYLIYNLSGELDDISHLFPNERLGRIAAIVRQEGARATIVDRANFRDLIEIGADYLAELGRLEFHATSEFYRAGVEAEAERLLADGYDMVFLNLWHGTGFKFSIDLARAIKLRAPALPIVGVGQKVDWFKEHILDLADDCLDGLVTGLGYEGVRHLVKHRTFEGCPGSVVKGRDGGVVFNDGGTVDVDRFPTAVYEESIYTTIRNKVPVYSLTLSNQACPNLCTFCIRPENYGRRNVARSPEAILAELRELHTSHGVRHVRIEDSTPPKNALTELARAIQRSDLKGKMRFSAFSRIDTHRQEDFALLREAGVVALFFGIESLDEDNLRRIRKGVSIPAIKGAIRAAHRAGIRTVGSFIFPLPGETRESMNRTLDGLREIRDSLDSLVAVPAGVYPHTEWGDHPERYGIALEEGYIERFITYPLKYLLPLRYWPPVPFKYPILGKRVEDVDFGCIVGFCEEFLGVVRNELKIPPIADYYFLLGDLMQRDSTEATRDLVTAMIARDYARVRELLPSA